MNCSGKSLVRKEDFVTSFDKKGGIFVQLSAGDHAKNLQDELERYSMLIRLTIWLTLVFNANYISYRFRLSLKCYSLLHVKSSVRMKYDLVLSKLKI